MLAAWGAHRERDRFVGLRVNQFIKAICAEIRL
jgi:hypothetical protein